MEQLLQWITTALVTETMPCNAPHQWSAVLYFSTLCVYRNGIKYKLRTFIEAGRYRFVQCIGKPHQYNGHWGPGCPFMISESLGTESNLIQVSSFLMESTDMRCCCRLITLSFSNSRIRVQKKTYLGTTLFPYYLQTESKISESETLLTFQIWATLKFPSKPQCEQVQCQQCNFKATNMNH